MSQPNVRRIVQVTLLLCLTAIYACFMVAWMSNSPPILPSDANHNTNELSNLNLSLLEHRPIEDRFVPSPSPSSSNSKFAHLSRKLKNHIYAYNWRNPQLSDQADYRANTIVPSLSTSQYDLTPMLPNSYTFQNDIFISVKTTKIFHWPRLDVILNTWFRLAKNQTYFFTDSDDEEFNKRSGGHLINTNCSASHNRKALCCKMSVEFDSFIASNKKWFCHFDDDNYVNVPQLVKLLRHYNPLDDWYLGKPSIRQPLEILDRDSKQKKISFWFATGGAGFCISKALALKMIPIASDGKLISVGEKIRLPDDVTIGYIIEHLLDKKLTVVEEFHSHLESMSLLKNNVLSSQVSFSYSGNEMNRNVLSVKKANLKRSDPTRFYALHCHLFPNLCTHFN